MANLGSAQHRALRRLIASALLNQAHLDLYHQLAHMHAWYTRGDQSRWLVIIRSCNEATRSNLYTRLSSIYRARRRGAHVSQDACSAPQANSQGRRTI